MSLAEAYKDWWEGPVGRDFEKYLDELIELNRDLLEGVMTEPGASDEMLRGRLANIRQIKAYISIIIKDVVSLKDASPDPQVPDDDYEEED